MRNCRKYSRWLLVTYCLLKSIVAERVGGPAIVANPLMIQSILQGGRWSRESWTFHQGDASRHQWFVPVLGIWPRTGTNHVLGLMGAMRCVIRVVFWLGWTTAARPEAWAVWEELWTKSSSTPHCGVSSAGTACEADSFVTGRLNNTGMGMLLFWAVIGGNSIYILHKQKQQRGGGTRRWDNDAKAWQQPGTSQLGTTDPTQRPWRWQIKFLYWSEVGLVHWVRFVLVNMFVGLRVRVKIWVLWG